MVLRFQEESLDKIFRDRVEAGQLLAKQLEQQFLDKANTIVLALPRGGVPVGYQIAHDLNLPLDVFLVRKLGVPGQEELALGAIALGGIKVFNEEVLGLMSLDQASIDKVIAEQQTILDDRNNRYRGQKPLPDFKNKTVILVDDGIATGATMRAAVLAIQTLGCGRIILAVPVAPPEIFQQFKPLVDQIICLETPAPFYAIGGWYQDFSQTTDAEVISLLKK
ncbi:MAG: phosphoribosyltransferase [Proteobacteria bacterium]|nr:phosphoribosyltransferase [Pseudomonadota bacterium]